MGIPKGCLTCLMCVVRGVYIQHYALWQWLRPHVRCHGLLDGMHMQIGVQEKVKGPRKGGLTYFVLMVKCPGVSIGTCAVCVCVCVSLLEFALPWCVKCILCSSALVGAPWWWSMQ